MAMYYIIFIYSLYQVPMFFRLVELCVAMYYGSIGLDDLDVDGSDDVGADAVMVQGTVILSCFLYFS